jgi:hypothetical protein
MLETAWAFFIHKFSLNGKLTSMPKKIILFGAAGMLGR